MYVRGQKYVLRHMHEVFLNPNPRVDTIHELKVLQCPKYSVIRSKLDRLYGWKLYISSPVDFFHLTINKGSEENVIEGREISNSLASGFQNITNGADVMDFESREKFMNRR